ncbi:MAG: Stp1/IreP family PP2C-type Ser/Thr phosphatase [Deltaproteobacteria bacterium]|nr:Stp1/IreP family PP2C-type Ser/Thr phosphatase [Deltaproteobacteria bacterium]
MHLRLVGKTDVGMVRDHNEDNFAIDENMGLLVVADGMGGHAAGEQASAIAVVSIPAWVREHLPMVEAWEAAPQGESPQGRVLSSAVQRACFDIHSAARENPALQGMGTTVVTVWARGTKAAVAHVGDSRVYLARNGHVLQITDDHSLVNEQVKAGVITEEQAKTSRFKNIITRSVGFEPDVAVDCYLLDLAPGDKILLCSDGLSNFVDSNEVGGALRGLPLDNVPEALIGLANQRGGDDNITVVCLAVES